ncbi:protein trichome birefringence-like 1 [Amaranthus tricolor]|uniref:protein trichome birefringence-like 1 n=1 Tax=Amaranthus tricolor TaxID=29722 RepID=UPI0025828E7A|nr:protein trichome birefringence-like 1 [Amaranthus tricolor]
MAAQLTKYQLISNNTIINDFKGHFSPFKTRKSTVFIYGVVFVFLTFFAFLTFSPSSSSSSWFINFFSLNNTSPSISSIDSSRSHDSQNLIETQVPPDKNEQFQFNHTDFVYPNPKIDPQSSPSIKVGNFSLNDTKTDTITPQISPNSTNYPRNKNNNQTSVVLVLPQITPEVSSNSTVRANSTQKEDKGVKENEGQIQPTKKQDNSRSNGTVSGKSLIDSLIGCDLYDGEWVRDDSYPLYKPGSCKLIDEQFNCFVNGRPDNDYMKLKWKPKGCTLPRLNGKQMLKLLKGKRLVFVGDSLNRNMWESLVCILKNSVKNPKNVYEAHGKRHFRTEASYSFVFKDYGCTIEFFVAPFLVQPWDVKNPDGTTNETLRLDIVVEESERFKSADVLVYNTGHWWTHEKTSKGEDYYQEGSNVYKQLDVKEAFRKAITTWGRWVDANINPQRTHIFFRGYSNTHFRGGQWNSGGQCDSETEPIRNEAYLTKYPWKMRTLEKVMKGMKTPISFLNITRMTDYRKDAHPSVYRKLHVYGEEKSSPLKFQDCSHWCLPGVPDFWNELLFAEMLRKQYQERHQNTKS